MHQFISGKDGSATNPYWNTANTFNWWIIPVPQGHFPFKMDMTAGSVCFFGWKDLPRCIKPQHNTLQTIQGFLCAWKNTSCNTELGHKLHPQMTSARKSNVINNSNNCSKCMFYKGLSQYTKWGPAVWIWIMVDIIRLIVSCSQATSCVFSRSPRCPVVLMNVP